MPPCGGCRDSHRQMLSGKCFTGVFETTLLNFEFDVEWSGLYLEFSAGHSEILSKPRFAAATDAQFLDLFNSTTVLLKAKLQPLRLTTPGPDSVPQSGTIFLASVQLPMSSLKSNFVSVVKSYICSKK